MSFRARQRLRLAGLPTDKEIGKALCKGPDGQIAGGPVAEGHMYGVTIPVSCPPGYNPVGTWHTHPGGVVEPSPEDWEMTRKLGFRYLCVTVPETGQTQCLDARKRHPK